MIQSKLPNSTDSIFSVMSKMAHETGALNLSQGFPDFESDAELIQLVADQMKAGHNQYAPMPGDKGLRQAISDKMNTLHEKRYDPDHEITVTAGATQAIFTALAATIHKGDEVILFAPAYDCYEPTVTLFGGIPKAIQLQPPAYRPDWNKVEDTINSKTKMIIINTPHNPSGAVWSEEDMKQLEALAEKHDLLVLSDEVYEHIVFDGRQHYSAARFEALSKRTFITASFGKTFHNTGWKMGYCLAPKPLMEEFRKVHQFNVFSVNHPIQKALATYLQQPSHYEELPKRYQQKRDFFLQELKGSRFSFTPSEGTYFQLLNYNDITEEKDTEFAERLTKEFNIATIPTSVFNKNQQDFKQLRICFAKEEKTLKKAAAILREIQR
ncbi:methionine aminotransferase [Flavobacteriaceae bacterium TK19130]|nr:methionine aminotransferase [Thermobacterium salinum]